MNQCRFTDEQIIGFRNQADAGMSVKELCLGPLISVCDPTLVVYRPKNKSQVGVPIMIVCSITFPVLS